MGPMDNLFDGSDAHLIPTGKSVLSADGLLPANVEHQGPRSGPLAGPVGPVAEE